MTSQSAKQIITIHILPNISRSKEKHSMKFGQLIEHSMKNIFLENPYAKCVGIARPKSFYAIPKLRISLDLQLKMLHSLFLLYGQVKVY